MLPKNISPIGDKILISVEKETDKMIGSLYVPDTVPLSSSGTGNDLEGTVLATGTGEKNKDGVLIPLTVKIGHKVLFPKAASQEITINGTVYYVIKEKDIHGIID